MRKMALFKNLNMRMRAPFGPGSFPNELDGDAVIKVGRCNVHVESCYKPC